MTTAEIIISLIRALYLSVLVEYDKKFNFGLAISDGRSRKNASTLPELDEVELLILFTNDKLKTKKLKFFERKNKMDIIRIIKCYRGM
jgi:hypothetical protein